jgi:UDP-glucuronate 4-epimerase
MRVLVTGTAGFIGFHLANRLLSAGHDVAGVDGVTDYYDVALKEDRLVILRGHERFTEHRFMLGKMDRLSDLARTFKPEAIVHLAAQAGVRYSLENPRSYADSNLIGTFNVMEIARECAVGHLLLASTSSIYGGNTVMPFTETERADCPLTFYAATKKATELMSHSYSHLWDIPTTVFRFFTVYGPWGRPDMALFKFVKAMINGDHIDVYNNGDMSRDFTYIDDLVESIARLIPVRPIKGSPEGDADSLSPVAPWRVVNIGGGAPVPLMDFVAEIERNLGMTARRNYMPMQTGDVPRTYAEAALLERLTGYKPSTPVSAGVAAFCSWYQSRYGIGAS